MPEAPIVIFGHSGLIGSALFTHCKERNLPVIGASSQQCDLLNLERTVSFVKGLPPLSNIVICSVVNRSSSQTADSLHKNISMAQNLLEALAVNMPRSLCYLSSVDVYGLHPKLPIDESSSLAPHSYYALSKYCCERLLQFNNKLKCPVAILRLPGIYGKGDQGRSIVGLFAQKLKNNESITLSSAGQVKRDYVELRNLCCLIEQVLASPVSSTINVATGHSLSLKELVKELAKALKLDPEIIDGPEDPESAGDLVFNTKHLQTLFPLEFISLEKGCSEYALNL